MKPVDIDITMAAIKLLNPKAVVSVTEDFDNKNKQGEWEETINFSIHYRPDGDGTELIEQPTFTLEEIRAKYPEAEKVIANRNISWSRKEAYGTWQDQLDKLYHDIAAGKLDETGEWFKSIKAVKEDKPFQ